MGINLKQSNRKGSIFTLLLKNYILLTIILIILLSGLLFCLVQSMNHIVSNINPSKILNYEEKLINQQYDDLPLTKLFGKNSGIIIYNDQSIKVYENGDFQKIPHLSKEDIMCIPEYTSNIETIVNDVITNNGTLQHSISIKEKDTIKTYILDENNNIIYQPGNLPFKSLNDKQVKLLSNSYFESYSIFKHTFEVDQEIPYTMIIFLIVHDQKHKIHLFVLF